MASWRLALIRSLAVLAATAALVTMRPGATPVIAQEVAATTPAAPSVELGSRPGAPEILRGSVAPPPPRIEPAAGSAEPLMAAGDRVWFVDRDSKRLTGCRLINTIDVATQAIRCTERRLPRGALVRD